ncbi:hypothetical protein AVEN_149193-1, partial [Araneus ventricosus]
FPTLIWWDIATMSDYNDSCPRCCHSTEEDYWPRDKKVTMRDLLRMMQQILEELRKLNAHHRRDNFYPQRFSPPSSPEYSPSSWSDYND